MTKTKRTQKYTKLNHLDHVLSRSDTYVGSLRPRTVDEYVADENFMITREPVTYPPGFLRIFIEPLSNAIDNVVRSITDGTPMTQLIVKINKKTGLISFYNDGSTVPIELSDGSSDKYVHSMIFGELLTGSNYDDEKDRNNISGKNGLGVKLCNIFSTTFRVVGVDLENGERFVQTWTNNMRTTSGPEISDWDPDEDEDYEEEESDDMAYTKVSFTPDFKRFGLVGLTDDIIKMFRKYVVDAAMLVGRDSVKVFFNGKLIPSNNLEKYAALYNNGDENDESLLLSYKGSDVLVTSLSRSSGFESIAFANRVYNVRGGVHVDAWTEALFRPIVGKFNKKNKTQINIKTVKDLFRLFVVSTVNKPEFDGQEKMRLEYPKPPTSVKATAIKKICSWSITAKIEDIIRQKNLAEMEKVTKTKKGQYSKIDGLDHANNAGGKLGYQCILGITEGLSAKKFAVSGLEEGLCGKYGRDWIGLFPVTGKILNTMNASIKSMTKNKVIVGFMKAMKIDTKLDYRIEKNYRTLSYGKIVVMTDADVDGIHIFSLFILLIHVINKTLLLRSDPFIVLMQTPIVNVFEGNKKITFFDEMRYRKYVSDYFKKYKKYPIKKYYKGLGTLEDSDVPDVFGKNLLEMKMDDKTESTLIKIFHNKHADARKKWLTQYNPDNLGIDWKNRSVIQMNISEYLETEMIKFSIDDCGRSIPSLCDGLKSSQRKIIYGAFKKKLRFGGKLMKVSRFGAHVAECSGYHHGEKNLEETVIKMANNFIGSNNIPLLYRGGQFASRMNGKDAASARYIFTKLDKLTHLLFRSEDEMLYDFNDDDGDIVEPVFYTPILPMALINGCTAGIGTGWSCMIPCYNPKDIIACVKLWIERVGDVVTYDDDFNVVDSLFPSISPWYRSHNGEMEKVSDLKFRSHGIVTRDPKKKSVVRVTELPVGVYTDNFKEYLETLAVDKKIKGFLNHSDVITVKFTITEHPDGIICNEKTLNLVKNINTTNMVMYTSAGKIKKFNTVDEIIDEFCVVRFSFYKKRKAYHIKSINRIIKFLKAKRRFVEDTISDKISLRTNGKPRKRSAIISDLIKGQYPMNIKNCDDAEEDDGSVKGYNYLLKMQILSLTEGMVEKLKGTISRRCDELNKLIDTSEADMWISDINEFEIAYDKWLIDTKNDDKKLSRKRGGK